VGLEIGELSRGDVNVTANDLLAWLKELTFEPYLKGAAFDVRCGDMVVGAAPNFAHINLT